MTGPGSSPVAGADAHRAPVPATTLVQTLRGHGLLRDAPSDDQLAACLLTDITDDSRRVQAGAVFIAVRGHDADGHAFIAPAIARGASLIVAEDRVDVPVPVIYVTDGRRAAAQLAAEFFAYPARGLQMVGVTGTNGKTTSVHLIRAIADAVGVPAASIGTLGVRLGQQGHALPGGGGLTTPGPVELQRVLRQLADRGIRLVAMEVSSHALAQARVESVAFDAAVFTNFTRDHLDYHGTMEAYFAAKARLTALLSANGVAVINASDAAWRQLPATPRQLYFLEPDGRAKPEQRVADDARLSRARALVCANVRFDAAGSRFDLVPLVDGRAMERFAVRLPLIGDFNVTNALGAFAALHALDVPLDQMAASASMIPQVPGRLERLSAEPTVLRDYAHTPDALERAIAAVRPFAQTPEGTPTRVHVVFGCGGDRDRGKRPEMGAIAQRLADVVTLTSDNPRTEDPERILDDIAAGCRRDLTVPVHRIEDRREAIAHAMRTAAPSDVVLLAGKGHETYQIRGTQVRAFDEAEIVAAQQSALYQAPYWTFTRVRLALQEVLLDVLAPTAASAVQPEDPDACAYTGVVTDTRTLSPGALFVALRGARHDAHDLLLAAQEAGAAAVVVDRPERAQALGIPAFVVRDTTQALGVLARAWRRAWGGTVVAVGGSNGKTSTKELLRAALGARWSVHATVANENNQIGVPLTLLAIPPAADVAVVEVGTNTPGEVALLRGIVEANVAVVTSLGEEHLEGLGDLDGVLREEAALFEGAPVAVVPETEPQLIAAARDAGCTVVTAGLEAGDVVPTRWALDAEGRVVLQLDGSEVTLPVRGAHQARNAMLAVAVARRLQVPPPLALAGLSAMALPPMRGGWEQHGACTVINDAYNANPPSMKAALALLDGVGTGRQRVAVLGTMRELGTHAERLHDEIARCAVEGQADIIVGIGDFMPAFHRIAPHHPRVLTAPDVPSAWAQLRPLLARDALLLLKGSRGARLETLLPHLAEWATT